MKVTVVVSDKCEVQNATYGKYISYGYPNYTFRFDYTNIDDAIKELTDAKKQCAGEYDSLEIREYQNCGCWGPCDCKPQLVLFGKRDENKIEEALRLEREEESQRKQEAQDRENYEKLKKKFDNE